MNKILFTILLAVAFFSVPAFALSKQVTNVGATASTIVTPGNAVHYIIIQNNGSGAVRLTFDGVTLPVATTQGYLLAAGTFIVIPSAGFKAPPIIKAILETGTTTVLDISTDDIGSS
jgi:hypothetical protein